MIAVTVTVPDFAVGLVCGILLVVLSLFAWGFIVARRDRQP